MLATKDANVLAQNVELRVTLHHRVFRAVTQSRDSFGRAPHRQAGVAHRVDVEVVRVRVRE